MKALTKRLLAAAIPIALAATVAGVAPAAAQEEKPNILFIMGDDIGWMQPSIYHQGLMVGETPNIDRIGHEGAKFMTYYAEQSCTAGRTAFFTGMTPLRAGMPPKSKAFSMCSVSRCQLHTPEVCCAVYDSRCRACA